MPLKFPASGSSNLSKDLSQHMIIASLATCFGVTHLTFQLKRKLLPHYQNYANDNIIIIYNKQRLIGMCYIK